MKRGKFELIVGKDGKYYYQLKASNGVTILMGRGYSSKSSVMHGIADVMESAANPQRFTFKKAQNGKLYFQLRSASGRIIGWSELYESEGLRDKAVENVSKWGVVPRVETPGKGKKPKFEVFNTAEGKYQFQLKASNGGPIMTGRAYETVAGAMHAIAVVMRYGQEEIRFVRKTSANYKFFFQLRSKTGRLIGWSQLYQTRQGRDNGIQAVIKAAPMAKVSTLGLRHSY